MDYLSIGIGLAKVVLIFYSFVSVAAAAERIIALGRVRRAEADSFPQLQALLSRHDGDGARRLAADSSAASAKAWFAGVAGAGNPSREAVGRAVTLQTLALQNNLPYLATIASTAPYVGLFGTVLGILGAFQKIAATGQTGPAVVSGSISEALVTTALGLVVAIPAAVAYNLILARVNALGLVIENHALDLADLAGSGTEAEGTGAQP